MTMRDTGCEFRGKRYEFRDTRYEMRVLNHVSRITNPASRLPHRASRIAHRRSRDRAFGVRSCNHTVLVTAHSGTSMGLRDPCAEWAQAGVNTSFTRCTLIFRVCFSA